MYVNVLVMIICLINFEFFLNMINISMILCRLCATKFASLIIIKICLQYFSNVIECDLIYFYILNFVGMDTI